MVASVPSLRARLRTLAVPSRWRVLVRRSEVWLIALALAVGAAAGALVVAAWSLAGLLHQLLFGLEPGAHLSSVGSVEPGPLTLIPAAGGLVLGLTAYGIQRWRVRRPVDPIEANALHGGRMSLIDSLLITSQTIISNGVGASVGLEAGYTQIGSAIGSRLGAAFRLRRADMRTLVGCGAAGAIAAAFGAPLTGSFYAFELIVGTYTIAGLAPIVVAAIAGVMVSQLLGLEHGFAGQALFQPTITGGRLVVLVALAAICAGFGVGIMRGVTYVEQLFKRSHIPGVLQPAVGGLIVGALALVTPQVLSSGHGALFDLFREYRPTILMLTLAIVLKATASAVSLGAGFRGGLFFASLFLGAMLGKLFAALVIVAAPSLAPDPLVCAIVGMAALAVAVVGGPLTMGFLALETTGDFPLTMMVLAASAVVSVVVRQTFGFSFTTWRMHLRGESIRSAHDIGWMRALTVERLMRVDVRTVPVTTTIAEFRKVFSLGATQRVVAVDGEGRYCGIVAVPDAHLAKHDESAGETGLEALLRFREDVLLPWMNIKQAAQVFEQSESEALAVVDSLASRQVVGQLSEAHVLRRYTEELDKARRDLAGEDWVRD